MKRKVVDENSDEKSTKKVKKVESVHKKDKTPPRQNTQSKITKFTKPREEVVEPIDKSQIRDDEEVEIVEIVEIQPGKEKSSSTKKSKAKSTKKDSNPIPDPKNTSEDETPVVTPPKSTKRTKSTTKKKTKAVQEPITKEIVGSGQDSEHSDSKETKKSSKKKSTNKKSSKGSSTSKSSIKSKKTTNKEKSGSESSELELPPKKTKKTSKTTKKTTKGKKSDDSEGFIEDDDEKSATTGKRKNRSKNPIVSESESEDEITTTETIIETFVIPKWLPTVLSSSPITPIDPKTQVKIVKFRDEEFSIGVHEQAEITPNCWMMNLMGPIWSLDWCQQSSLPVLAVAPYEKDLEHLAAKIYGGKSQVYIVSFNKQPKIYSILNFDHGFIYQMKFVHANCESDKRIGILSIAFADGTCGVYVVPKESGSLVLSGFEYKNDEYPCTCVSWSHDLVYLTAGFGDGSLTIFKVDEEKKLIPIYQNNVMVASVKSLSWCSVCPEFFLATSLDQFVYLFDVREPWRVISQLRNSASWSTCTEFPPQSNGCLIGNHAGEVKILDFEKTGGGLAGIMKDLPPIWDMSISSDSKNVVFACGDGSIRTSEFKYPKRHRPGATLSGNRIFGLSEGPKHYVVQFEDDEYEKTMNELKTSINQVSIHPKMMDLIAFGGQQGLLTFLKK